jgi:hypothetical protein
MSNNDGFASKRPTFGVAVVKKIIRAFGSNTNAKYLMQAIAGGKGTKTKWSEKMGQFSISIYPQFLLSLHLSFEFLLSLFLSPSPLPFLLLLSFFSKSK